MDISAFLFDVCPTGQREHHRDVSSDLSLCGRRTTRHRDPRHVFVPVAGPAM